MNPRFLLLLLIWLPTVCGKKYKSKITKRTRFEERLWKGMMSNTGQNQGGFLVQVRSAGPAVNVCGGAYIRPLIVLSSASCVTPFRYQSSGSYVATTTFLERKSFFFSEIEAMVIPEDYVFQRTHYDIAIIKIKVPLAGLLTEFIQIASSTPMDDEFLYAYGWGYSKMQVRPPSEMALSTPLQKISRDVCLSILGNNRYLLGQTAACAYQPESILDCVYEAGSPVTFENKLVGIISTGFTCMNTSDPAVYTDLVQIHKFIKIKLETSFFKGKTHKFS
ncbi:uncharacterized protein Dmoj_GI16933 [Drosophila mojavensis]|uniref:trypsin n=1 Tax=Drosophila mojavensis TaxID=7230 RepID=B4KB30_DROMO|nr:uncharacterized protein Dmoj_GI16933 [Drosophila mojavensis]